MPDDQPNSKSQIENTPVPTVVTAAPIDLQSGSTTPTGGRAAFRDLKRQLSPEDLTSPGTQKMILEMLSDVEAERNDLKEFETKFHEVDKRCAVMEEKLHSNAINEIIVGVGTTVGGIILGLSQVLWSANVYIGIIMIVFGLLLIVGSAIARIKFK